MLIIQKLVVLLDDFHLEKFTQFLETSKANLPKKLVEEVAKHGLNQPESDAICLSIYGKNDEKSKKNFFQLAHHTLKLSFFLSRNYPNYLSHNRSKIESLINEGRREEANQIAEILLDVAQKIEDRITLAAVLKYFAQQSFHLEQKNQTINYHKQIATELENEKIFNELYLYLRTHFNVKNKLNLNATTKTLEPHTDFFNQYINHSSFNVQFLARYAKIYALTFLQDQTFFSKDNFEELLVLERDLEKNAFVVFPFLEDILFKLYSVKMEYMFHNMSKEEVMEETIKIIKNADYVLFWKNFINIPEMFALAVQTSYYISLHMDFYKDNFSLTLPNEVKEKITFLRQHCEDILNSNFWEEGFHVKRINLISMYSALLIMGDKNDLKKAVELVEQTLVTYQQISFQKYHDSIFATLIMSYFGLKDYANIADSFKRYKKLTSDNLTNEENDITICGFYYMSQWLASGKKQYREKFVATIDRCNEVKNLANTKKALIEMANYYDMPL
ncbi:MAG: hypothetical protein IT239_00315 [Bacteroidia bacterium]|nr:hypothetical protein [Bacteroidia bacterium]